MEETLREKGILYLKVIELDSTFAIRLQRNLGYDSKGGRTNCRTEARKNALGQKELYLKVIELKPTYAKAYDHLGVTLKAKENGLQYPDLRHP